MKQLSWLAGILCLALAFSPGAMADDQTRVNDALSAAVTWVGQIDSGYYEKCYDSSSDTLKDKVNESQWTKVLATMRGPWGPVVSRKQVNHVYRPDGYDGNSGEYMVVAYNTSFQKLNDAVEIVVLKRQGGQWRGAGYTAGARPTQKDPNAPDASESTTQVNTQMHVKPGPDKK